MEAVAIPNTAFTWAGFRAWVLSDDAADHGRVGFLGDMIHVDVSPERFGTHAAVRMGVQCGLYGLVKAGLPGYLIGRGLLFSHEVARIAVVPDLMYASFDSFDRGRVTPDRTPDGEMVGLLGSADVIVEVVSDASDHRDTVDLPRLYHAAGVQEYWLIDARGADIRFDLLRHTPDGFQPATPTTDGWRPSAAFGHEFLLTRDRDPAGDWDYTLHARPLPPS